jgi:voltage-gated potassium channel
MAHVNRLEVRSVCESATHPLPTAGRRTSSGLRESGAAMWQQDESGRVKTPFEPLILAATLAMIPVLIIERDANSDGWQTFAQMTNWLIWGVFALDLVVVLLVARRKWAALSAHWLDAAIVVVTIPFYGTLLSSLRLVRLVNLLRLVRAGVVISRALQAERRLTSANAFRFISLATILVVIAGAVQATVDSTDFESFWEGVWWAVSTVTTVGYGDIYPTTVAGRLVAMGLMLVGIGFLAVLTATIASLFVKADRSEETTEILDTLRRIEADVAELKAQIGGPLS